MNEAEKLAASLHLRIERDSCRLQRPLASGRKRLLAAVYPERRKIVLFECNIADHCRTHGISDMNTFRARLVQHEIGHYVSWLKKRRRWAPRDPAEEVFAERFATVDFNGRPPA